MLPASIAAGTWSEAPGGPPEGCPNRILCMPSPWRDTVLALCSDYEKGCVPGWPDRYSASAVAGVRYLLSESGAALERLREV